MPVFLLPIIAGGYYYYKNLKENERDEASQEQQQHQRRQHARDAQEADSSDLASSSIEVSLVAPSETEVGAQEMTTIMEEVVAGAKNHMVLHRKGSTDTAQTEISAEEEQIQTNDDADTGLLGATCGGCDRGALLEIVECGNSLEKEISVVFSRE